jgi:hypothetical protein
MLFPGYGLSCEIYTTARFNPIVKKNHSWNLIQLWTCVLMEGGGGKFW